jgi:signal transduction histidine kinase
MMIVVSDEFEARFKAIVRNVIRTPITRRTWAELCFLLTGSALAAVGLAFIALTMGAGIALTVTFFGLSIVGLSLRGARGFGGFQRQLSQKLLGEHIDEPDPFLPRPGFFGWLQSVLRDRTAWRAVAYLAIKVPLAIVGLLTALSIWFDAFTCLVTPLGGGYQPKEFGLASSLFRPGYVSIGSPGWLHGLAIFCTGVVLLFAAPWAVRVIVMADRYLMHALLGPDAVALRTRSLEQARAQTVDASAAVLRRIERDLHDGTQAQLVTLAMRLGLVKEKLADPEHLDLEQVAQLVSDAHRGAKEAIVELRDLARGIHPPALDIGLEGALATLTARSTTHTELKFSLEERPTPAIETIAYFCVAELLANIAQHAHASRATVSCAQYGKWLRLVVRDDGIGGAQLSKLGSSSSGLIGLTDRVNAVDGHFEIVSPPHGPTVVTVDLPLHA